MGWVGERGVVCWYAFRAPRQLHAKVLVPWPQLGEVESEVCTVEGVAEGAAYQLCADGWEEEGGRES